MMCLSVYSLSVFLCLCLPDSRINVLIYSASTVHICNALQQKSKMAVIHSAILSRINPKIETVLSITLVHNHTRFREVARNLSRNVGNGRTNQRIDGRRRIHHLLGVGNNQLLSPYQTTGILPYLLPDAQVLPVLPWK